MAEPADVWLEREGVSLHCLEWRPDSPRSHPDVLLLHGLGSSAQYWSRMAEHLPHRRLVALDQRGHGQTGRPPHAPPVPEGYATEALLADIEHVTRSVELDRPVLVGHSWGATISLEFAARHPLALSALVFIDGPVQSAANLFSWEEGQEFMQPPLPRYTSFAQAVEDCRRDFEGAWGEDLEPFVFSRLVQDGRSMILTLTGPVRLELLRALYQSPVEQLWAQLEAPARVLLARHGPSRVVTFRESGARKLELDAPNVSVRWFDAPHDIPIHAPAEVAAEVEAVATAASETPAREQLQD